MNSMTAMQPEPEAGYEDVTPRARELFHEMLSAREQKGIATYGTTLQTFNGRNAVQDALEELIDGFQYVVQIGMENRVMRDEIVSLRARVAELERELAAVDAEAKP